MLESRFHGLGGQGVVLAAHLLGRAALRDGRWAHSFPFFTTAMRGGMVNAFTRIDEAPIDQRCFVYTPDALILFHEKLLQVDEVVEGVRPRGMILVNTREHRLDPPPGFEGEMFLLDARGIAERALGRPVLSTVMAGAAARALGAVPLEALRAAIVESFAAHLTNANLSAAEQGYHGATKLARSAA